MQVFIFGRCWHVNNITIILRLNVADSLVAFSEQKFFLLTCDLHSRILKANNRDHLIFKCCPLNITNYSATWNEIYGSPWQIWLSWHPAMTENKGGVKYGNMSEIGMSKEGKGFKWGKASRTIGRQNNPEFDPRVWHTLWTNDQLILSQTAIYDIRTQSRKVKLIFLLVTVQVIGQLSRLLNLFQLLNGGVAQLLQGLYPLFRYTEGQVIILPTFDFGLLTCFRFHLRETRDDVQVFHL